MKDTDRARIAELMARAACHAEPNRVCGRISENPCRDGCRASAAGLRQTGQIAQAMASIAAVEGAGVLILTKEDLKSLLVEAGTKTAQSMLDIMRRRD